MRITNNGSAASNEGWIPATVSKIATVAEDILCFELRPPSGMDFPPFAPGAHIDVRLPNGVIRQYSLCNDSAESDRYEIAIQLEPLGRGGSLSAHRDIREGDCLRIGRPRNLFSLHDSAHSVLIAGGIGVTPLLSMAEQLHRQGADFAFHYCARSPSRMAYRNRIAMSPYKDSIHLHFDDGPPAQRFDARTAVSSPAPDTHLYVCGPSGFMAYVIDTAKALGWPDGRIHFEHFSRQDQQHSSASENGAFDIRLASNDRVIRVPAEKTIAQALAESGVSVPLSCEQGICGTCLVGVIEGVPAHRDQFLSDAEKSTNKKLTTCCSRSQTACLVLDL